jgi:cyclic beta-1,2-glucan synthetase
MMNEQPYFDLSAEGRAFGSHQPILAQTKALRHFRQHVERIAGAALALAQAAEERNRKRRRQMQEAHRAGEPTPVPNAGPGVLRLEESGRLLRGAAMELQGAIRSLAKLPFARSVTGQEMPRIFGVAHSMLSAARYNWTIPSFSSFLLGYQTEEPLTVRELSALPVALKHALLEEALAQAQGAIGNLPASDAALEAALRSLNEVGLPLWANILEPLVPFEPVLRQDPAQAYANMDYESREIYRLEVARIARHSHFNEVHVARTALELAQAAAAQPDANPRITARRSHVGYYLVGEGVEELEKRTAFEPTVLQRLRAAMRRYPDDFYIGGILVLGLLIMTAIIAPLVPAYSPLGRLTLALLLLLLPASQGAVELVNNTVTALLKPRPLPKLDFSEGIPEDCKTIVAVPTLLLNEAQVRGLVEDLEVRSLANQDANISYALLTDLPDSVEKPSDRDSNPLVQLAASMIERLNEKYAGENFGGFFMLHRHRTFNPRQGVWMGWERKRGKLMDLNRLIIGGMDAFPIKVGNLTALHEARYVLTLDSDTKLPRDSVRRMVGAIAHPLNRAILDPRLKIVTQGYGLLQPRVSVTVQSVARSRLASLYSGETGFDIYTRAVSDVYQDLYGEGIFTGKGLYEIAVLHEVLEHRFPQNFLLSHDLIEGAYARAGLLTDVEVMDDYPSHYSAQNRRKHRWVRGDWQILRWLLDYVPDDKRRLVRNPISTISRWKILDNLRRSLVEPATFLLLTAGWLWLPGRPRYWTIATLLVFFVPALVQTLFSVVRAAVAEQRGYVRIAIRNSLDGFFITCLNFAFLAHQTLLMADAIFRSLIRSFVTGRRLLEWETAAEAESGVKRQTPVEITMRMVPFLCIAIALLIWMVRPLALPWALPILLLWALTQPITRWLNRPTHDAEIHLSGPEEKFLRQVAWRTWRYFARFSTEASHSLVPDNVQLEDDGSFREAMRLSPTNAGLQLNARQAAVVLGYLTLPEYAEQTLTNVRTLDGIPKWHGHLLNWFETDTLKPIRPYIASSVDSGNFLASLCSLRMGTLELQDAPLLAPLAAGLADAACVSKRPSDLERKVTAILRKQDRHPSSGWLHAVLALPIAEQDLTSPVAERLRALDAFVAKYLPWLHPKFAPVEPLSPARAEDYTPMTALETCHALAARAALDTAAAAALRDAAQCWQALLEQLDAIAEISERMFHETDYKLLVDPYRRLLTIGYNTETDAPLTSCYDLLASEARTAMFLAVAKGDVLQETWFKAGRKTRLIEGVPVMLSWSGTMFEYMMPALWMQTFPGTLLAQSLPGAVTAQRMYVARQKIPWGISEAGYSRRDPQGNYHYHAFGVPALALNPPPEGALVIAPYATLLALGADPVHALQNMRRMEKMGWLGEFGFYEAADYSEDREPLDKQPYVLVKSWMAHHQGMSLLALTNLLAGNPFQRWFHADPRVRATEMLLHEKPLEVIPPEPMPKVPAMTFPATGTASES